MKNKGMKGFRSWWKKNRGKVKAALSLIGPIGVLIGIGADIAFGKTGDDSSRSSYEYDLPLTSEEEFILDDYVDNQFIPFYNDTIKIIDGVLLSSGRVSVESFLDKCNRVLIRIALLRAYLVHLDSNPPYDYSENMLLSRRKFVNEYLDIMYNSLINYCKEKGIDLSNTEATFFRANDTKHVAGMSFLWKSRVDVRYMKIVKKTDGDNTSEDVVDLETDPLNEDILNPTDTTETTTTPNNQSTTKKSNTWLKVAGVLGLSYVLGKAVSRK